jgi:diguanylate cyclase (GGDEF)-like protein
MLLSDRLDRALERADRRGNQVAALFVDLDDFKTINDSLGHEAGDDLLRAVAHCLRSFVGDNDTAARLGGDEFVLLLEDVADEQAAAAVAERLAIALQSPVLLAGQEIVVTASIGVAVRKTGEGSVEQLMRDADQAVYCAKASGKARYAMFEQAPGERAA